MGAADKSWIMNDSFACTNADSADAKDNLARLSFSFIITTPLRTMNWRASFDAQGYAFANRKCPLVPLSAPSPFIVFHIE
jgi:hypothetical protein